jgi:hypothetical protein
VANKFKHLDDSVFRVVGEKADGTLEVLQGPYASRGVARGQATALRNQTTGVRDRDALADEYVDIYAQETKPNWFRV